MGNMNNIFCLPGNFKALDFQPQIKDERDYKHSDQGTSREIPMMLTENSAR